MKNTKKAKAEKKEKKVCAIFEINLEKETTESLRALRHQFYARRTNGSDETKKTCNARIKELHDILVSRKKAPVKKAKKAKAPVSTSDALAGAPDTDKQS